MRWMVWSLGLAGASALAAGAALVVTGAPNHAADHLDPPGRTDPRVDPTADPAADLADVFVWNGPGTVRLGVTFGGPFNTNLPAFYDRNVLYKLLISTAPPHDTPEIIIRVKFAPGTGPNEHGVQITGVPGVTGAIEGPVETVLVKDGVRARAGLHDDPFFFDARGLAESRTTGQIRISNQRDFFAAQNVTVFVIEVPRERFAGGTGVIKLWTTTARFGGQL